MTSLKRKHQYSIGVPLLASLLLFFILKSFGAEQGLKNCADLFPGKSVKGAPSLAGSANEAPAPGNVHMCERTGNTPFFGLEYDSKRFAPVWVGYRIANTFGKNGCASMTRKQMQCHFKAENIEKCIKKKQGSDPFHSEKLLDQLSIERLGASPFGSTGHDRGHMAPNNSFSWHACGAYKTFTMANMSAQWGPLNRQMWANLEAQVLYWGIHEGPIHVFTGPIWSEFPASEFKVIKSGDIEAKRIVKPGERLKKNGGQLVSPPVPLPTGFFKVVFRPAQGSEPDRAIAFLAPHTKESGLKHWDFATSIKVVEKAASLRFGFSDGVKGSPDLAYWQSEARAVPGRWDPRKGCKAKKAAAGWMPDSSVEERLAACHAS